MAEIRPFTALRYAEGTDLAAVTCPPYDVLSPEEKQALQDRSPHAAARLILPTGEGDARYQNAADLLADWTGSGALREDATPGLYVTRTEFTEPGGDGTFRRHRLGLVCLLRLHGYADRVVLPHERTLSRPKEDRLKLLRATQANVESIMGLVDDQGGALYDLLAAATRGEPLADFTGDDHQRHTLYKVEDAAAVRALAEKVAPAHVYIADGHHRYETSVAYAQETGTLGKDAPEAFILATLSSLADPGLAVLPTHRLVKDTPPDLLHTLFAHLEPLFDVRDAQPEDVESRLRLSVQNQPVFGLALPSGHLYQLTLRAGTDPESALPADIHPALRPLEAVLLQHLVLGPALGISASEVATTDRMGYTRSFDEAVRKVHDGEYDVALLLGRPPVTAVRDVSLAGEVMPQKSTYFYPKLLSGLVMRRF
jgi:uncharacterized protein (DUF1015 family)